MKKKSVWMCYSEQKLLFYHVYFSRRERINDQDKNHMKHEAVVRSVVVPYLTTHVAVCLQLHNQWSKWEWLWIFLGPRSVVRRIGRLRNFGYDSEGMFGHLLALTPRVQNWTKHYWYLILHKWTFTLIPMKLFKWF